MIRSYAQNNLYHSLIGQLYTHKVIQVWDGNFIKYKMPNPIKLRPTGFNILTFREIMKSLDLEYPRDDKGIVLSSAKLTIEQLNKHITFLEVLLMETK